MKTLFQKNPSRLLSCLMGLLLLLGGAACKKIEEAFPVDEQKMPAATQEGKDTFGCLVNGKLWLPYNPNAGKFPFTDYEIRDNTFPVNSPTFIVDVNNFRENVEVDDITLYLGSTGVIKPGVYALSDGFRASARSGVQRYNAAGQEQYSTANAGSGTLTITKVHHFTRTVNRITTHQTIVSGTFQFTAKSASGKTITVTDGRFDLSTSQ